MKIKKSIKNSVLEYCIDEYVRLKEHREILRQKWFEGMTITQLSAKHNLSDTAIKNIIYKTGDEILLIAEKISTPK